MDLIAAKDDTLRVLADLIAFERRDHAAALAQAEAVTDSLRIDATIAQGILDRQGNPPAPVWAALGSRTAVFCYGFALGVFGTVQAAQALD